MRSPITIAAFSDVHGPRYLQYLASSAAALKQAELVLVAGDIVDKGVPQHCRLIMDVVRSAYKGQVFAVFGNEEYDESENALRSICSDVTWLKDGAVHLDVRGFTISIVGTRGVLDEPTSWQRRNVPNIRAIYEERLKTIANLLGEAKRKSQLTILLTHYAPICSTLTGERPSIWSQMGSRKLTEAILRYKPDIVVHGHSHNSTVAHTRLGPARVYNVAIPAVKKITTLEVSVSGGLDMFL